jgi:hypothetical protein
MRFSGQINCPQDAMKVPANGGCICRRCANMLSISASVEA